MVKANVLKKEKGTINSTPDSVKNQDKYTEFIVAKQSERNYFVKRIILNRKEIQILLSNSINFLDNKIVNQKNRIGNILLNEKEKIENSLIKSTNNL